MQIGLYSWAGCLIEDVGVDGPDPYDRRHTPAEYAEGYLALLEWAKLADRFGYAPFAASQYKGADVLLLERPRGGG